MNRDGVLVIDDKPLVFECDPQSPGAMNIRFKSAIAASAWVACNAPTTHRHGAPPPPPT